MSKLPRLSDQQGVVLQSGSPGRFEHSDKVTKKACLPGGLAAAALAVIWFLGGTAFGATYFSAANGDWNTAGNWTNGLPSSSNLPTIGSTTGGLATATATISGNVGNSGNTISMTVGDQAGTNGTVIHNAGTVYLASPTIGNVGTGTYTQTGGAVIGNTISLAAATTDSVGTYNLTGTFGGGGTTMNATALTLGTWGNATFNQVGGTVTVNTNGAGNTVGLGINSSGPSAQGRGTYNLSGNGILNIGRGGPGGPPFYTPVQGILRVGSYGSGTFNIGDATSSGTVNETGTGTLGVQVTVRAQNYNGSAGTIHGWGSINTTGTFTQNGKVQADGYGTDRTLSIASYSSLANGIANPTTGGTNGWFAVNHGKLVLKDLTIASGSSTLYWGDNGNPDLVNALQLSFASVQTGGTLSGSLLAPDRTDVWSGLDKPIGVWNFTPGGAFNFGSSGNVTLKFRYDDALAASLGIPEANLRLYRYTAGSWQQLTATIDATNNWLTASGVTSFSQFAISAGLGALPATIGAITSQTGLAVITGGSVPVTFTVQNSAATGSGNLSANITAGTNTSGTVAGPIVVTANSTSGAISGLSFNGTTVGLGRTGNFTVTDPAATNSPQAGTVTVDVYNHASGTVSAATLTLPSVHVGYTGPIASVDSLTINNVAVNPAVNLKTTGVLTSGNVSLSANAGGVAPGGASGPITAGLASGQGVGAISQVFTLTYADDSALNGASGSLGTANVTVTGLVYSGQGVWNTNGSGLWQDAARWTTLGGVPGVDGILSANDTATFGSALSAGPATVSLNGTNPTISGMTFDNGSHSYTIAQGTGGNLVLAKASGVTVGVINGSHMLSAPVVLNNDTTVNVANLADTFTISGEISGTGNLSKSGAGTMSLGAINSYTGSTIISTGILRVSSTGSINTTAAIVVGSGATLDYQGSANLTAPVTNSGGTVILPADAAVTVAGGSGYAGYLSESNVSGGLSTQLTLLDGTAGANHALTCTWRGRNADEGTVSTPGTQPPLPPNVTNLISDVVDFSGTGGDLYALQLNYNPAQIRPGMTESQLVSAGLLYLAYNHGGTYEQAGTTFVGERAYNSTSDFTLGNWGVDTTNHVAWAVVNHNSEWAVVPEPGTLALLAMGSWTVLSIRRKKSRP